MDKRFSLTAYDIWIFVYDFLYQHPPPTKLHAPIPLVLFEFISLIAASLKGKRKESQG
jgi:hypothetical protein